MAGELPVDPAWEQVQQEAFVQVLDGLMHIHGASSAFDLPYEREHVPDLINAEVFFRQLVAQVNDPARAHELVDTPSPEDQIDAYGETAPEMLFRHRYGQDNLARQTGGAEGARAHLEPDARSIAQHVALARMLSKTADYPLGDPRRLALQGWAEELVTSLRETTYGRVLDSMFRRTVAQIPSQRPPDQSS